MEDGGWRMFGDMCRRENVDDEQKTRVTRGFTTCTYRYGV
jgi:hypothetical protein